MNSFISISKTQTTDLDVVASGTVEALLATALSLVAEIPAVVIYNAFVRSITDHKANQWQTRSIALSSESDDG